jgi:hypothetical protein
MELERDCAKVEVARSNRARSTKCYGVAESERRESLKLVYVGSSPTSVAKFKNAGVAQLGEALVLETSRCGFESLRRYQTCHAVVAQLADAHG